MLNPRIYRTGFVAVVLAVVVLAFSLLDQQAALTSTLAPDAFNGSGAYATMTSLASATPDRRPGSTGDNDVASYVAGRLRQYGYSVSTAVTTGRTADGNRSLETVTGARVGLSTASIVVLAHRDSANAPAAAELSGTATLLELARVLAGQTQHRTIVLASTSGSAGLAGATQLAHTLPGPIDAVIALGDLAGTSVRQPIVVPWSSGQAFAPPALRNTLAAALGAQAGISPGGLGVGGQFAHLAFPFTLSEQGPFGARGVPAVSLSLSGDRTVTANGPTSADQLSGLGRAVLQTISALDAGPDLPVASPYMLLSSKVVPAWAVRLLVLALILPVLLATVDGLARVRRRGYSLARGIVWAGAGGAPFLVAAVGLVAARRLGALAAAPPGPVGPGMIPPGTGGVGVGIAVVVVVAGLSWVGHRLARRLRTPGLSGDSLDPARGVGVLILMCLVTLAIWMVNPFAALLVIPALHLWMWVLDGELRPHPILTLVALLIGLVPPALVAFSYAHGLGFGLGGALWSCLLLIAGGQVTLLAAAEWSLLLGCVVGVGVTGLRSLRQTRLEQASVTLLAPATYPGPGSLGGTGSAIRR